MTARARCDLTMDAEEKDVVSCAAALMGVAMADFVRVTGINQLMNRTIKRTIYRSSNNAMRR